ncbi:MAG TPA: PGPGW domain-containing protein [Pseudonocardia sp.]|nr:PGPGW domain-containing protein [Pseudonocardia sp.]
MASTAKRLTIGLIGGFLVLVGIVLLVLPGPGLLLVLAGLIVLSTEFPALDRYIDPIQHRAMAAAEQSVSSPPRLMGSVLVGLVLIAAGVVWGLVKTLPLGGWPTGSSLILSGVALLGMLLFSYVRAERKRRFGRLRSGRSRFGRTR